MKIVNFEFGNKWKQKVLKKKKWKKKKKKSAKEKVGVFILFGGHEMGGKRLVEKWDMEFNNFHKKNLKKLGNYNKSFRNTFDSTIITKFLLFQRKCNR